MGNPGSRREEGEGKRKKNSAGAILSGGGAGKMCSRTLAPSKQQVPCLFWDPLVPPPK